MVGRLQEHTDALRAARRYRSSACLFGSITWQELRLRGTQRLAPAVVHWSADNWKTVADVKTADSGLGLHYADLPTNKLPVGGKAAFTFFWPDADKWEGTNWEVAVVPNGERLIA